jgi:hypothetical protein
MKEIDEVMCPESKRRYRWSRIHGLEPRTASLWDMIKAEAGIEISQGWCDNR